jgi:hypothetical protein
MRIVNSGLTLIVLAASLGNAAARGADQDRTKRLVLVELYTSQGCDMCPEAERLLGVLAEREPAIVPIAFHVDYFNDPWKDPFSDALYSRRQMAYNAAYTKPKNSDYGLYYTPMLMIDGVQSVNGRDPAGAAAAVREAMARKPEVAITPTLELKDGGRSGDLTIKVAGRSGRVEGKDLLVCAVLRDDKVVTQVGSGENANKALTNRFPARSTKYDFVKLAGKTEASVSLSFSLDPSWRAERLGLVIFVQDKQSGAIYQAATLPWKRTDPAGIVEGSVPDATPGRSSPRK